MRWDISIQHLPEGFVSIEHFPGDLQPEPIGPRSEWIAKLREPLPEADFTDPSWRDLGADGFSIAFNMGEEETCSS